MHIIVIQIFPDPNQDHWSKSTAQHSSLMCSDSLTESVSSNVVKQQRRRSSTGNLKQLQDDIKKSDRLQLGQTDEQTDDNNTLLVPVKLEAIGTPSSVDSTELNPLTVVTQQVNGHTNKEDVIHIHHESSENGNGDVASSDA